MGLIYVNPEGPGGIPDSVLAAKYIRETFRRMAMNDEETAALIIGGHTVGKAHGAAPAASVRRPRTGGRQPGGARSRLEEQLWQRQGRRHDHQRAGGRLDQRADQVGQRVSRQPLQIRLAFEKEPRRCKAVGSHGSRGRGHRARCTQSVEAARPDDAHDGPFDEAVSDLCAISKRFHEHPDQLAEAFAKAWYKLLHRDMGPVSRYLGPWVPAPQLWQDPVPAVDHELIGEQDIAALKGKILASGLSVSQLVSTAWASAASFRGTDKRGGANGARIRLAPQKDWEVNHPAELSKVLQTLEKIQQDFNRSQSGGKKVSLADLIVLGGCAAVEQAAKNAGYNITVPFAPGRTDASQEQTDVESFAVLEPTFDGFRNYVHAGEELPPETLLVERAFMLNLTAPEMTVLVGGMRALNANSGQSKHGVFTKRPGTLTNDFFVNLLDMSTEWKASGSDKNVYEGHDRKTGAVKWTGTVVDLVFGYNSQLRALAEFYAQEDSKEKFVRDFVAAWDKVMNNDRFDLERQGVAVGARGAAAGA